MFKSSIAVASTKMYRAKTGSSARSSPLVRIEQRITKQQLEGALSDWEKVNKTTKPNSVGGLKGVVIIKIQFIAILCNAKHDCIFVA